MEKVEIRDGQVFDIAVRVTCRTEDGREHTGKIVFRVHASNIIGAGWPSQIWDDENPQFPSEGMMHIIPDTLKVVEVLGTAIVPGDYLPLVVDDLAKNSTGKVV